MLAACIVVDQSPYHCIVIIVVAVVVVAVAVDLVVVAVDVVALLVEQPVIK